PCPFTSTPPTEFYTLSLHDALPISVVPDRAAEIELLPGVCASQPGGHFPGSAVVHWTAPDGEGVLFTGDTIGSVADPRWVTFMRSFPNWIPLSGAVVLRIADHVSRYDFDRIYSNFGGRSEERRVGKA